MSQQKNKYDLIIIGAGFAGMYSLYKAKLAQINVLVIEKASGVGGTWYWNRYPGARCDVESMQYSYQFSKELQDEWEWTEKYATQSEILKYANHVAERFNLKENIKFNTEVKSVIYKEENNNWVITDNNNKTITSTFCIMATGCLSTINKPNFKNINQFSRPILHTGTWPHEKVNLKGKKVGIIGTGSSAIQCIPEIIKEVDHLYVFQRTPHYTVPARNRPLKYIRKKITEIARKPQGYDTNLYVEEVKAHYKDFRLRAQNSVAAMVLPINEESAIEVSKERRKNVYEDRWKKGGVPFIAAFQDLNFDREANETAAEFVRNKIKSLVEDSATAKILTPKYPIGCKRLAIDSNYYETFNKPNISLIDLNTEPLDEFVSNGLSTFKNLYELDVIILATGFDAMTGTLFNIDIQGKNNIKLKDKWADGPKTYLGLTTESFPNFFIISGPGSPSVLTNMIVSIEQHVNWIFDCFKFMKKNKKSSIEASLQAEQEWGKHNQDVSVDHVRSSCSSWYMGANIKGKARIFMPYVGGYANYVKKCNQVSQNNYEGFIIK